MMCGRTDLGVAVMVEEAMMFKSFGHEQELYFLLMYSIVEGKINRVKSCAESFLSLSGALIMCGILIRNT